MISRVEQVIPPEINDHLKIFGKDADEVDYDSIQGEAVSIPELKKAIVQALQTLMTKSDTEA